ncbi:hypothetical protein KIW84_044784 [Lathyrus oleraceus]|uniref:Uncharacterized protein n=1 Tax=Pisum sativum TaxID=3888 RepID=A0A9D5AWB1_PEA|nr:hypothetical protein KIW84_044784 [Pisum sativum]
MVKEITIRFDWDNINEYLKNPLTLREGDMCAFTKHISHHWDINEISNSIYRKDKVKLNAFGLPVQYLREYMIPSGQIIIILILQVDVERIIENELKMVVKSGWKPGAKLSSPLVFLDLIMGLCVANRIVLPKKYTKPSLELLITFMFLGTIGRPEDENHQVMEPEAFQSHINLPEVRPFYQWKAATSGDEKGMPQLNQDWNTNQERIEPTTFPDMDGTLEPFEYLDTLVETIKLLSWDVTKKSEALSKAESSRAEVIQPYDSTQKNIEEVEKFLKEYKER